MMHRTTQAPQQTYYSVFGRPALPRPSAPPVRRHDDAAEARQASLRAASDAWIMRALERLQRDMETYAPQAGRSRLAASSVRSTAAQMRDLHAELGRRLYRYRAMEHIAQQMGAIYSDAE